MHIANSKNKKTDIENNDYLLCMHAVFMGMPTASSKGGVPLTGMQPLTTMPRQTLEAACNDAMPCIGIWMIGAQAAQSAALFVCLFSLVLIADTSPQRSNKFHSVWL